MPQLQPSMSSPSAAFAGPWIEPLRFVARAMAAPRRMGAILPSGPALGRTMSRLARGPRVVELGPGSGSITRHLLERLGAGDQVLALELDPVLAGHLREHLPNPRLTIRGGDAAHLEQWLARLGWTGADTILSGLPFQSFPAAARESILRAARASLSPGGRFVAFQYGLRLLPTFQRHFRRVRVIGPIWRNLPPAYIIVGMP
jgi:phospholipid N-methyltransferase